MSKRTRSTKVILLGAVATLCGLFLWSCGGGGSRSADGQTFEFVIPAGADERLADGESITIMPKELEVKVGDRIKIVNNDSVNQSLGPYSVAAGSTLTQTFVSPGDLTGDCPFTDTGQYLIRVSE